MESPRWKEIRALVEAALARPGTEREAFVRAEASDDVVRREALALLDADEADDPRLEPPSPAELTGGLPGEAPEPGTRLGAYELTQKLGEGGMGTVWRARRADEEYEKEVAVKVLRTGIGSPGILERFRVERQVLADLEHPGIARLIDGGEGPDGRPYLVMELVEGEPLPRWCDARRLDVRGRVELFARVCDAVHYAHQHLVVHRDLKPTNVLVTAEGDPKLLDFGIAKVLQEDEDGEVTHVDERALTPGYASPEQVRGERVTTTSDVYSLGVLLYELLADARPYRVTTTSRYALEKAICETEPLPPSEQAPSGRRRALRGDLDAIVMTCLRKEPGRRHASALELAEDLRRHLRGLPVSSRPDSLGYRAGRFVLRNRFPVATASLLAATLVAGVTVSTRLYVRAEEANEDLGATNRTLEEVNEDLVETNRMLEEVNASEREARRIAEARRSSLDRVLEHVFLRLEGDVQPEDGRTWAVKESLLSGLTHHYDRSAALAREREDDVLAREAIRGYLEIARRWGGLGGRHRGQAQRVAPVLEKAEVLWRELHERSPDDLELPVLEADILLRRSGLAFLAGDSDGALDLARDALDRLGPATPDEPLERVRLRREAHGRLGDVLRDRQQDAEARRHRERALELSERLARTTGRREDRRRLAGSRRMLGEHLFFIEGEVDEALELYGRSRNELESLVAEGPDDTRARELLGSVLQDLAAYHLELGQASDAHDLSLLAIEELEEVARQEPQNVTVLRELALAHQSVAQGLGRQGREPDAISHARRALEIKQSILARDPESRHFRREVASARATLAQVLDSGGRQREALEVGERCLETITSLWEEDPDNVHHGISAAITHYIVGNARRDLAADGELATAERLEHARLARDHYQAGLDALTRIHEAGKLQPTQHRMLDDFARWVDETEELVAELSPPGGSD